MENIFMITRFIGDDFIPSIDPDYGFATKDEEMFEMVKQYVKYRHKQAIIVDIKKESDKTVRYFYKTDFDDDIASSLVDFEIINKIQC